MAMLWAVTGISGFVGRSLAGALTASGHEVRGLVRKGPIPIGSVLGDVREGKALRKLVSGADIVVHLAAYVHRAARTADAKRECWSVNVEGTQALIDAVAVEAPEAFLILISSASVYGPGDGRLDETWPCRPVTPYGRSKLEAERRMITAIREGRIRGCVVRPAMIFGPGAPGNLGRLAAMVRRRLVIEIGGGHQRKSLVPVTHAVEAICAIAAYREACNGEVFNLAGEALTIHEIVLTISQALARRVLTVSLPSAPLRVLANAADLLLNLFPSSAPPLRSLIDAYSSNTELDGSKLLRTVHLEPVESVRQTLAAAVR